MTDETPTPPTAPAAPVAEMTVEEKQKAQKRLDDLKKMLNIDRINEDVSALREDVNKVSSGLTELIEAINNARNPQDNSAQTSQAPPRTEGESISKEEAMLLLKDVGGIAADIFKTYKGVTAPQQAGGAYGDIIMQSLARAFQVHVDDIVSSTLQRLPPDQQVKYITAPPIPQPPVVQPPPPTAPNGFLK